MRLALKKHWPEYLLEALGVGLLMLAVGVFAILLNHPELPVNSLLPQPFWRRVLMGLLIGLTITGLIYSPWGRRSGAHINPAVTLTFLRLGKIVGVDAFFYIIFQCLGGIVAMILIYKSAGGYIAHPSINYLVTMPGAYGAQVAFVAEVVIAFVLMTVVLNFANRPRFASYTGIVAGLLVASFVVVATPYSGTSLNPARTLSPAVVADLWTALWIYLVAPPFGMLVAAEIYVRRRGWHKVFCAKLHHDATSNCIFRCGYHEMMGEKIDLDQ